MISFIPALQRTALRAQLPQPARHDDNRRSPPLTSRELFAPDASWSASVVVVTIHPVEGHSCDEREHDDFAQRSTVCAVTVRLNHKAPPLCHNSTQQGMEKERCILGDHGRSGHKACLQTRVGVRLQPWSKKVQQRAARTRLRPPTAPTSVNGEQGAWSPA